MKAHSRTKGRPTLRQSQETPKQATPNTDQVLERIKAITDELETLQSQIHHQINQDAGRSRSGIGDGPRARLLGDLKVTLDRLRQVLWLYLEQGISQPAGAEAKQFLQPLPWRRDLYSQSSSSEAPHPPSGSFFDRLDVVIDAYMKNTTTRSEAGPRKRAKS